MQQIGYDDAIGLSENRKAAATPWLAACPKMDAGYFWWALM
jgi:hypothetical protein